MTMHIQRRYHWIRERVEEREFVLTKIQTTENGSNMLTKVLTPDKLEADRIGAIYHAGVKGEFVGKHVPPDGRCREPAELRTGPDRSDRSLWTFM